MAHTPSRCYCNRKTAHSSRLRSGSQRGKWGPAALPSVQPSGPLRWTPRPILEQPWIRARAVRRQAPGKLGHDSSSPPAADHGCCEYPRLHVLRHGTICLPRAAISATPSPGSRHASLPLSRARPRFASVHNRTVARQHSCRLLGIRPLSVEVACSYMHSADDRSRRAHDRTCNRSPGRSGVRRTTLLRLPPQRNRVLRCGIASSGTQDGTNPGLATHVRRWEPAANVVASLAFLT
jgi:hypothetical protein